MNSTHPQNIFKYCPKCGSSNFRVTGERCLKCSDCGFVMFVNATAAVAALIANEKGELLLTVRGIEPGYGMLDLPGGFVNPLESAEDAVRRELMEELGMETESVDYLFSAPNEYIYKGLSVFTLDMAFRVIPKRIEGIKAMDDIKGFKFCSEAEINYDMIPAPSINYFVRQFFQI